MTPPTVPRERTALAWQRTALGAFALGAGLLRLATLSGSIPLVVAAGCSLLAAGILGVSTLVHRTPPRRRSVVPRLISFVTVCVICTGVLAVAGTIDR
jgi:uncharacterized membrane protein YidH (DUF202 family)